MPRKYDACNNHRPKRWRKTFIAELRKHCNVSEAARRAGVDRRWTYTYRDQNATFAKQWDDAINQALDDLEQSLYLRGKGYKKAVFYQGVRCDNGEVIEFDTTAAIFILKHRRPEVYGDRSVQVIDASQLAHILAQMPTAIRGRAPIVPESRLTEDAGSNGSNGNGRA